MKWTETIDRVESHVEKLNIPELSISKVDTSEDFLPSDPSNISPKEIADKLFEYSAYVSYLDVEIGRIDSQKSIIDSELTSTIEVLALEKHVSKPKARACLLSDASYLKAAQRSVELDALYKRMVGLRSGYNIRLSAISREISRRHDAP